MLILHSYDDDWNVEYLVTTDLQKASNFIYNVVCGDDEEIPDWVVEYVEEIGDKKWNKYARILNYCVNLGVSMDTIGELFPTRKNLIEQSTPVHFSEYLNMKIFCREAVWLLSFLFSKFSIVLSEKDLISLSDLILDVGDGPSYPHVICTKEKTGKFQV